MTNKEDNTGKDKFEKLAGEYLTFYLDEEEYGIEILKVIEIIGLQEITPVPKTPEYVKGVLNLRGIIHPIIDLKQRFSMGEIEPTKETCIIIVVIEKGETNEQMGIIVDKVHEVKDIDGEVIDEAPDLGTQFDSEFILGMAKEDDSVTILLDIEKILSKKEVEELSQISDNS